MLRFHNVFVIIFSILISGKLTIVHALRSFADLSKHSVNTRFLNHQTGLVLYSRVSMGDDKEIACFLKEHPFIVSDSTDLLTPAYYLDSNNRVGSNYMALLDCYDDYPEIKDSIREATVEDIKSCFVDIAILGVSINKSMKYDGLVMDHLTESLNDLGCTITAMEFIKLQDEMRIFLTDNQYFECDNCAMFSSDSVKSFSPCKGSNHQSYGSVHQNKPFTYDDYQLAGISFLQYLDESVVQQMKSMKVIEMVKSFAQSGGGYHYDYL